MSCSGRVTYGRMLPEAGFLLDELTVVPHETTPNKFTITMTSRECEQFEHLLAVAYVPVRPQIIFIDFHALNLVFADFQLFGWFMQWTLVLWCIARITNVSGALVGKKDVSGSLQCWNIILPLGHYSESTLKLVPHGALFRKYVLFSAPWGITWLGLCSGNSGIENKNDTV